MTAGTVDVGTRASRRLRVGLGVDVIAVAGPATLFAVLAAATWGTWGDLDSDTGYDVVAGNLVAQGQLPYVDFVYYYGPLAPPLAGARDLAGRRRRHVRHARSCSRGGIVLATYALRARSSGRTARSSQPR